MYGGKERERERERERPIKELENSATEIEKKEKKLDGNIIVTKNKK